MVLVLLLEQFLTFFLFKKGFLCLLGGTHSMQWIPFKKIPTQYLRKVKGWLITLSFNPE